MSTVLITIVTVVAVALIHFSYVDFRFRYREGFLWFWMLNPAPPIMWVARATAALTMIAAFSGPLIGVNTTYVVVVAACMAVHLITLILVEVLEPR